MRRTLVSFALIVLVAHAVEAEEDSLESLGITVDKPTLLSTEVPSGAETAFTPLYTLADNNFSDFVSTSPIVLVEFYAPWCSVCKSIKNEYLRAAWLTYNMSLPVSIAQIVSSDNKETADSLDVTKIPRFFLFRNGSYEDFPMLTTGEAFVAGLDKLLGFGLDMSPVKNFGDDALEVASWLFWRGSSDGTIQTTMVIFDPPGLEGDAAAAAATLDAAFVSVSKELMRFSNLRFARVSSAAVFDAFGLPIDAAHVAMYMQHDEGKVIFGGAVTHEGIKDWILRYDIPLVEPVSHHNLLSSRKRVNHFGVFFLAEEQFEHPGTLTRVYNALDEILYPFEAAGHFKRGELTIGVANGKKYGAWLEEYGKLPTELPALVLEDTEQGLLFSAPDFTLPATSHPSPEFLAAHPPPSPQDEGNATDVNVDAESGGEAPPPPSLMPKLPPLTWVEVPVKEVTAFFQGYFSGRLAPFKALKPFQLARGPKETFAWGAGGDSGAAQKRVPQANTVV